MTQEVRNRKKKEKMKQTSDKAKPAAAEHDDSSMSTKAKGVNAKVEGADGDKIAQRADKLDEESLWQTFRSHPLIRVIPFVLIPYVLYHGFFFFQLQHPEYLGSSLRPAVGLTDERQFLIVGTMSSGLIQVARTLFDDFGLEVVTEASDTSWFFARDGTVSWFHGTRFLPRTRRTVETTLGSLCVNYTDRQMGFHPSSYRSNSKCSTRSKWDRCWAKECLYLLDGDRKSVV